MQLGFGILKVLKMILCSKNLNIQVINDDIFINSYKVNQSIDIVELIQEKTKKVDILEIDEIKNNFSRSECMILLAISFNVSKLIDQLGNKYEVTFSYHFPLNYEQKFIRLLLENLDYVVKGNLINLATYGEFITCSVNDGFDFCGFKKKYAYLLRYNDIRINMKTDVAKVLDVLNHWNKYCYEKFNKKFSDEEIISYNYFYSMKDFHTISLINKQDEIVAEGIVFESKETKTLYYCIFWWDKNHKSLSLGIYNYVKIICYCNKCNLKFSFCYGLQNYKIKLLSPFLKQI